LNIAAVVAFSACVVVLLPCALFRATRKFSAYGFFISSVIFGVATWILGLLVTFQHWGGIGVFVGIIMGVIGIVPLGMLAAAFNEVWPQVGDLALGLVLTFGARMTAATLAAKADHDEVGSISNSRSEPAPIGRSAIHYATDKWRAFVRFDRIQSQQIIMTAMCVLVGGGFAVRGIFDPARYDHQQAMINFQYHPIESIVGSLLPAVILSPIGYWVFGLILRRRAAHFKVCEHCAETIKAAAKVCRYCDRDVASTRQVEVGTRQRAEEVAARPSFKAPKWLVEGLVVAAIWSVFEAALLLWAYWYGAPPTAPVFNLAPVIALVMALIVRGVWAALVKPLFFPAPPAPRKSFADKVEEFADKVEEFIDSPRR
jgi:hypothetical protein